MVVLCPRTGKVSPAHTRKTIAFRIALLLLEEIGNPMPPRMRLSQKCVDTSSSEMNITAETNAEKALVAACYTFPDARIPLCRLRTRRQHRRTAEKWNAHQAPGPAPYRPAAPAREEGRPG